MNVRFIKSAEKKEILEKLKEYYGIEDLPYLLFETGKEKVRIFSGSFSKDELLQLGKELNVEIIGLYALKQEEQKIPRLSFDAVHMLKNAITKNIVTISDEQLREWIRGHDLAIQAPRGPVIVKYNEDLIGCAVSTGEKIYNYTPKERRVRK